MSKSKQKLLFLSVFSVLLSLLTLIMGTPFMRVLYRSFGALPYWLLGVFTTAVLLAVQALPLAYFIGSVWMTLGAYMELERRGVRWWPAGWLSLIPGSLFCALGTIRTLQVSGINSWTELQKHADRLMDQIKEVNPTIKFESAVLLQQIPSVVVVLLILALAMGIIFEKKAFAWLNLPRDRYASQLKLLEYRMPDYFIWVAMLAFLLTMVSVGWEALPVIALNIVNVAVVLYFFQGLAVLEVFLNSIKAGPFIRFLTYLILVGNLFVLISIVGLADYWVDFRKRIRKMQTSENA